MFTGYKQILCHFYERTLDFGIQESPGTNDPMNTGVITVPKCVCVHTCVCVCVFASGWSSRRRLWHPRPEWDSSLSVTVSSPSLRQNACHPHVWLKAGGAYSASGFQELQSMVSWPKPGTSQHGERKLLDSWQPGSKVDRRTLREWKGQGQDPLCEPKSPL